MEEKIFHMAGAKTPIAQKQEAFEKAIREAGREPVPRDTKYNRLPTSGQPAKTLSHEGAGA
jgi:aminodeoxyfutalosine synthase